MVPNQGFVQRMPIIACCMIICCMVSAQQGATAQASGGVKIVWQKPMNQEVAAVVMSPGGRWAMTADGFGSNTRKIRIRDMETGDVVRDLVGPVYVCFVFGQDSTTYMTVTGLKPFKVSSFSTSTGGVVDSAIGPSFNEVIMSVYPFADRVRWVVSTFYGLFIYNTMTKQTDTFYVDSSPFPPPIGNYGGATWIGISEDEKQMYTYGKGADGESPIRLCAWDVSTRKLVYQKEQSQCFSWIPMTTLQSRFIIGWISSQCNSEGAILEIYDLKTGELVRQIPGYRPIMGIGTSLSIDGRYLANQTARDSEKPVQLVDTEYGNVLGEYVSTTGVRGVQFLPGPDVSVLLAFTSWQSARLSVDPTTDVLQESASNTLKCAVLPNPGDGTVAVSITLTEPAPVKLRLVSTEGKVVQESDLGQTDAGTHIVPVRALAGYYQCTVTAGRARSSFPIIIR